MSGLKLAVIGAGSTYTPEIVEGLIQRRETLPIEQLYFMDIDPAKMATVSGLVERMLQASDYKGQFTQTTDLGQALDGADYVIAQIRVGGLEARIRDEKIPLKYDLLGQETTGIGGFLQALRTVDPILDIAHEMERRCPEAWFINFSNPSGILAEAVLRHTGIHMLGLCNCPINMLADVRQHITHGERFAYDYVGLNHLSWITSVRRAGVELLTSHALTASEGMKNIPKIPLGDELLQAIGAIPSSYLGYYYKRDAHVRACQAAERCRGEECQEIEANLLAQYGDTDLAQKPDSLAKRGGALYSTAAVNLINSLHNDLRDRQVVNTRNQGALPFLADDDVVEVQCVIGKDQVKPVPVVRPINLHIAGLIQAVKAYEKLTVEAALSGDRAMALAALLTHPLIGDFDRASTALNEMLEANRAYLPRFFESLP